MFPMKNNSKATKTQICKAIPRRCLGTFSSGLNPAFGEAHAQLSPSGREWKQVAGWGAGEGSAAAGCSPNSGPFSTTEQQEPPLDPPAPVPVTPGGSHGLRADLMPGQGWEPRSDSAGVQQEPPARPPHRAAAPQPLPGQGLEGAPQLLRVLLGSFQGK